MIKHFTYDWDLTASEILSLFAVAADLKKKTKRGQPHALLAGKSLAMIFAKPSTRTRVSFEVGMTQLGGHALYLGPNDLQLSRGETIADTARVLSRYVDGIMARVFAQSDIDDLAAYSTVPVINGLSDTYHPCQVLTDLFTIWEKKKTLKGVRIAFVGDGDNNVTNSLLLLSARLGVSITVACPKAYMVRPEILTMARKESASTGAIISVVADPREAVEGSTVVATDVWVSMGRTDAAKRKKALSPYQVNARLLSYAADDAIVLHCLPAHRGEEITDEVIDGTQSVVFDEAENRLHVQKALLVKLLS